MTRAERVLALLCSDRSAVAGVTAASPVAAHSEVS